MVVVGGLLCWVWLGCVILSWNIEIFGFVMAE